MTTAHIPHNCQHLNNDVGHAAILSFQNGLGPMPQSRDPDILLVETNGTALKTPVHISCLLLLPTVEL